MKIQMSVASLRAALAKALGVAGTKTGTMPILSAVLLSAEQTAEGGRLTVRAYDLEIEVTTAHACEVAKPGAVALPARLLADVAKALSGGTVALSMASNNKVELTCGAASFRLAGLPAEDFPTSPQVPKVASWQPVHRQALREALARVTYAMSSDETRYNLNGVFVQPTDDGLALVASDGHRLASAVLEGVPAYGLSSAGAIVGRKAVDELTALLADDVSEPGDLVFTESAVLYRRPGLAFSARLVDGAFPDWTQVLPPRDSGTGTLSADRTALRDVLRRVLLLTSDVASPVTLTLGKGELRVSARHPERGDAVDRLVVDYAGPALEVTVNGRYLTDLTAAESAERLEAWIDGDMDPLVWAPLGASGVRHVLMPMRR